MVIYQLAVLSLLIIQAISAPTGCIESCGTYFKKYETSGHFNDHGFQSASQLQGSEYSKPGTWTEHNDYNVDNGHGKVHEERGQYVAGPKTVRYYKKNYTSSYSTGYGGGLSDVEQQNSNYRHGVIVPNIMQSSSQRVYDQVGHSDLAAQQHRYNTMQSQQRLQSSIRSDVQSARLEDFGEHIGESQVLQHGLPDSNTQISQVPYYSDTQHGNWSKVDSYKTDGGHGRVFKVEGQYVTGPKKVRYYSKNYTSSYSSHSGIPEPVGIGVQNINEEIDKLHREIGVQTVGATDTGSTSINSYDQSNLHNIHSNQYGIRNNHESSSSLIHNEQQLHQPTSEHVIIRNPSQNSYGVNSHNIYEQHESHAMKLQPVGQFINPTPGYTNVLNTANSAQIRNVFNTATSQQQIDNMQVAGHLNTDQSGLVQSGMFSDHIGQNGYAQNSAIQSGTGQSAHYKEHWSHASHTKETSVPQYSTGISHVSGHNIQDGYLSQLKQSNFNSGHQTPLGKLASVLDLGLSGDTVDCGHSSHYDQHSSQYKMKYKRDIKDDQEVDDTFQQHTQQSYQPWKLGSANEHLEDLTQQTSQEEDLTQQTSGKLEFGQESQQTYQPWKLHSATQHSEDLTQQTSKYDDFSQLTSENLEFGQESQQSYQPQWPGRNKHSGYYTQQLSGQDQLVQHMTGTLELEQQSQHTSKLDSLHQQVRDLTQQTSDHDDLTQQTSGKLEFGQHSQHTWKLTSADQVDDLSQQTSDHDDLTQQTSGKLEFGQQPYQPWKPNSGNQQVEDLTQQTSNLNDFTQQTSGKLEFGRESQQSSRPWRPSSANQEVDDLTQQTGYHEDLTQQTSGKLEFGQHSYQPWNPSGADQIDDLTQQTSGKLEFGQQPYQPRKPNNGNQHVEDLTQETSDHRDFTQQTSGKLEFGQQPYQPRKPNSGIQHVEDLTQQTSSLDDFTQQTSGKLEFGRGSQQSYQPWKPSSANQEVDDLTQQTGDHDDFTQQASGKLEFGQYSQQPWKLSSADQVDELTQQTSDHDDLTQQISGKLEFGQQPYQSRNPNNGNQRVEDLTQQTRDLDDYTQQTSGKLEFGQESQQSYHPWKPSSANQEVGDLTQQTGQHEDLTQQTSGKLEFGQHSYQPWKPSGANQEVDDLTQQTGDHDDLIQQTSGKLEFGQESQHSYHSWQPNNAGQYTEDLTQQTGMSDDFTQQSGKLEFGQQSQVDMHQFGQGSNSHIPKPAGKPKPRSRYSRTGPAGNVQIQNQNMYNSNSQKPIDDKTEGTDIPNIYEIPAYVDAESDRSNTGILEIRGDQAAQNSNKNNSKDLNKQTAINAYNIEGENVDQVNWLHKSNDATVGLQWHYTYHPSDQRQFVQQTDRKDKENLQQQISQIKFSDLQHTLEQQETQDKHLLNNLYQQSSNQNNEASNSYLQSQTYASGQGAKFDQVNQQTSDIMNEQKHIQSSVSEHQLEPRILEAYGGGPYEGSHNDDIYHGLTVNPSATLPPINSADPWDIREKPMQTTLPPMPVEPLITDYPTEGSTPPPSFWSKLGYKITNTFDKAKEKARTIFG